MRSRTNKGELINTYNGQNIIFFGNMVTMELFNCYLNINWNIASGENLVSGEIEYDFY